MQPSPAATERVLPLVIVAGHLNENVSFIFSLKVVAVDNANRIVKLQTMTVSQTGTRIQAQHPAVSIITRIPVGIGWSRAEQA